MSTNAVNLLMVAVIIPLIWRTLQRIRRDDIGFRAGVMWIGVWIVIAVVSLFPWILETLQSTLHFQYRLNMAFVAAIVFLLIVATDVSSQLERMKRNEARAIQEAAVLNHRIDLLTRELEKRTAPAQETQSPPGQSPPRVST